MKDDFMSNVFVLILVEVKFNSILKLKSGALFIHLVHYQLQQMVKMWKLIINSNFLYLMYMPMFGFPNKRKTNIG
jgi:hypothetical protein